MSKPCSRIVNPFTAMLFCVVTAPLVLFGCSHMQEETQAFREARDLTLQGRFDAALTRYGQISAKYPGTADRALFETGMLLLNSGNEGSDSLRALESFQRLIRDYPESVYRKDSQMMVFTVGTVAVKDQTIAEQRQQIGALREELRQMAKETQAMREQMEALEQEVTSKENHITSLQNEISSLWRGPAEKIVIEKKERRLTLLANGKAYRTYKVALGGNPVGPKERQGDNKTPEGTYIIDARNEGSSYHLALHISYPNEQDKWRAKKLGVPPGGDIMIHGLKNGFSWLGDLHTRADWTKGCIAVTDEEIEEIARLAPVGTVVEIRP